MPCFLACLAAFFPRVAIILIWLFGNWLEAAYQTVLWPVLGFIFFPYTTLAYALAWHQGGGTISGIWLALVVVAVLVDLGSLFGGGATYRTRPVYRKVEVKR